jgi:acetyl-CoA carboxylase biotin carboxyl carrier protein
MTPFAVNMLRSPQRFTQCHRACDLDRLDGVRQDGPIGRPAGRMGQSSTSWFRAIVRGRIVDRRKELNRAEQRSPMTTKTVHAPIPGTFYRRPAPDQPPFKNDGDRVATGDPVGLIEVMKTFTQVLAEETGRILRFLVENEDAVMAGDPLYELEV